MNKTRAQICFSVKDNFSIIEAQLRAIARIDDMEFYSVHLPRHIAQDRGLPTTTSELLEEVLGDRLTFVGQDIKTYEDFKEALPEMRSKTAKIVDKVYVLGEDIAPGICEEIQNFTDGKVVIIR